MPLPNADRVPTATFRVQLHHGFSFHDLLARVNYLRALGVSDLYLSPIFTAAPGSLHGYDVNDYLSINPELGGEEGFDRLSNHLGDRGMGILLDIVPNHMGISGPLNRWWQDVLENGEASAYAPFFDIQWNAGTAKTRNRVLVPLLPDQYGAVLEAGELSLVYTDAFFIKYSSTLLPVTPGAYGMILGPMLASPRVSPANREEIERLWAEYLQLAAAPLDPEPKAVRLRTESITRLKRRLALWHESQPDLQLALAERLAQINGRKGVPESFNELDAIIEQQHYRIARWKTGAHEINYRRFFAIDSLVGVHEEDPAVFNECHRLIKRLVREGRVTGLRVDHIDGLRQPQQYLDRLQAFERPEPAAPLYTIVEKILAQNEGLPTAWPVHGTTGYEFIPTLSLVLVDAKSAGQLDETYRRFTGASIAYADEVYAKKRLILDELFANAVNNLGTDLAEIVADDRKWKDTTRTELVIAVREVIAHLGVYRTYRSGPEPLDGEGVAVMNAACAGAIARNPSLDPEPFELVRDAILGAYPSGEADGLRARLLEWVLTFQQYTGAVTAKAVEDTTFYTYCRFIALNEVGSDPAALHSSLARFHQINRERLAKAPLSLLTSSTHDTKVSEDVRARMYAISEVAERWDKAVDRWHLLNERHLSDEDGARIPDRLDEYRFYQTLIGVWPLDPAEIDEAFCARLKTHIRKAVDEAKRHTSILQHNERYHAACLRFVEAITDPVAAGDFLADFVPFAQRLAHLGLGNSLTQLVLKCTVPGIPDFYQGNDLWDFSLVDPDNRRPVDYDRRVALLATIADRPAGSLLEHWRDGGVKLRVTQTLLRFRLEHPALFAAGSYRELVAGGTFGDHVIAFIREGAGEAILVVVPRLSASIGSPAIGLAWDDTELAVPGDSPYWENLFTGEEISSAEPIKLRTLFSSLPCAVLRRRGSNHRRP